MPNIKIIINMTFKPFLDIPKDRHTYIARIFQEIIKKLITHDFIPICPHCNEPISLQPNQN